ncbi:hypothetical protein ABK040_002653 [Willaertia magna]
MLPSFSSSKRNNFEDFFSDKQAQIFFTEVLKPVCLEIANHVQTINLPKSEILLKENLIKLNQIVLESKINLQTLLDYISFPLLLILEKDFIFRKRNLKQEENLHEQKGLSLTLLEQVFDCLFTLFSKVSIIEHPAKYFTLYQSLFLIHVYYSEKNEEEVTTTIISNEELKFNLVKSFHLLISKDWKYSSIIYNLFSLSSIALFISKLLDISIFEKNRDLQLESILCIKDLINITLKYLPNLEENNNLEQNDVLSCPQLIEKIFPGIISKISKLIYLPNFTSTKVQCATFQLFSQVTCIVCKDNKKEEEDDELNSLQNLSIQNLSNIIYSNNINNKNERFEKFIHYLEKIFSIENYSHFTSTVSLLENTEIQIAMLEACENILLNCQHTLKEVTPILIECLLSGGNDNSSDNNYSGNNLLDKIEITSIIEDRYIKLLRTIPNICKYTTNEKQKATTYKLFYYYTKLFLQSSKLGIQFLSSSSLLSDIILILIISLQMDQFNLITEENNYPKKIFKNFIDERIVNIIYNTCELFGKYLGLEVKQFFDYLIDIAFRYATPSSLSSEEETSSTSVLSYRNESLLVCNKILKGLLSSYNSLSSSIAFKDLIIEKNNNGEEYVKKRVRDFINQLLDIHTEALMESNDNQVQVETNCLLLENIALLSQFIDKNDKEKQNSFLIRVLYPILNQLGYSSIHIQQSCFKALNIISQYFYPEELNQQTQQFRETDSNSDNSPTKIQTSPVRDRVMKLLVSNFDYMVDDIRYRMKYLSIYPHIPRVLNTLFEFNVLSCYSNNFTNNSITIIEDCIESIFSTIDQQQLLKNSKHLPMLFSILGNIIKTLKNEHQNDDKKELTQKEIDIIKSILQKTQHFVNNSQHTLIVSVSFLNIIENSIQLFENSNIIESDEENTGNKILPIVHILWPIVVTNLTQKRTPFTLKQKAIDLIGNLTKKFDDFLYGRIVSDLYPILKNILKQLNENEMKRYKVVDLEVKLDYFRTEPEYKYLKSILKFFLVIVNSEIFKKRISTNSTIHVYDICNVLSPFLDESVPPEFQQITKDIFKGLEEIDGDSLWLYLMEHCPTKTVFKSPNFITNNDDGISFPSVQFLPQQQKHTFKNTWSELIEH